MLINNVLNKVILEKWSPKNKKKHSACKAKVKSRVKDWPSAYASGQVVQCYYNEEIEMESLKKLFERSLESNESADCGCDKKALIMEALKKKTAGKKKPLSKSGGAKRKGSKGKSGQIGSPWFRHKQTGSIISRHAKEGRRYMTKGEQTDVSSIASGIDIKHAPDPTQPAKTREEIKYATAVKIAAAKHGNPVGQASHSSRRSKKKVSKKSSSSDINTKKKEDSKASRDSSIRAALARIDASRRGR